MATTTHSNNSNNGTSNSSLTVEIKALNISLTAHNNNDYEEEQEKDSHCGTTDDFESPTSTPSSPKTFYVKHSVLSKIGKWNKLQNYGHTALGDAVIPLKTPIDHKYLAGTHWPRFSIHDFVFEQWRDYGRLIGMMIDLSNHDCIYDYETIHIPTTTTTACATSEEAPPSVLNNNFEKKSHLEYMGLSYVKHRCISKECPDLTNIRAFMKIVYDFKQQYPNHYIGVHCSYGFNRTGFVLCSFLAESGVGVDDAVRLFAESRQPGIKHKWFIEELKLRYDIERSQALSSSPAQPTTSQSSSSSEGPMTTATITKSTEEEESPAHDQETYK